MTFFPKAVNNLLHIPISSIYLDLTFKNLIKHINHVRQEFLYHKLATFLILIYLNNNIIKSKPSTISLLSNRYQNTNIIKKKKKIKAL